MSKTDPENQCPDPTVGEACRAGSGHAGSWLTVMWMLGLGGVFVLGAYVIWSQYLQLQRTSEAMSVLQTDLALSRRQITGLRKQLAMRDRSLQAATQQAGVDQAHVATLAALQRVLTEPTLPSPDQIKALGERCGNAKKDVSIWRGQLQLARRLADAGRLVDAWRMAYQATGLGEDLFGDQDLRTVDSRLTQAYILALNGNDRQASALVGGYGPSWLALLPMTDPRARRLALMACQLRLALGMPGEQVFAPDWPVASDISQFSKSWREALALLKAYAAGDVSGILHGIRQLQSVSDPTGQWSAAQVSLLVERWQAEGQAPSRRLAVHQARSAYLATRFGMDSPRVHRVVADELSALLELRQWQPLLDRYVQVVDQSSTVAGSDDPLLAVILGLLAYTRVDDQLPAEGLVKALTLTRDRFQLTVTQRLSLDLAEARLHAAAGRHDRAGAIYKAIFQARDQVQASNPKLVGMYDAAMVGYVQWLIQQDRQSQAQQQLEAMLAMSDQRLGSSKTLDGESARRRRQWALIQLADIYAGQKQYDKAAALLARGLQSTESTDESGLLALRLGRMYLRAGEPGRAVQVLDADLENSPDALKVARVVVLLQAALGSESYDRAVARGRAYMPLVKARLSTGGDEDISTLIAAQLHYAAALDRVGSHQQADRVATEALGQQAQQITRGLKEAGRTRSQIEQALAGRLIQIGRSASEHGDWGVAHAAAQRAVAVLVPSVGRNHLWTGLAKGILGRSLIHMAPAEAPAPLESAYAILVRQRGEADPMTVAVLTDLVKASRKMGDRSLSARYGKLLADVQPTTHPASQPAGGPR